MGDFVQLTVSNSQNETICMEKKFPKDISISNLKSKLEIITGACAGVMQVELYNGDSLVAALKDDQAELGSYPIENGMRIHVVGNTIFVSESVDKFELSEKQYDEKSNTLRGFLKTNQLGKYNDVEMTLIAQKRDEETLEQERQADLVKPGDRCLVKAKGPPRLGTVMYKGSLEDKTGVFVGVNFDEPLGIHDGTVNGKRYFTCDPKHGSMVPIASVEVGDFPPVTDELSEDDEI